MKQLFETIETHQSAVVILAIILLFILSYIKGFILEAMKPKSIIAYKPNYIYDYDVYWYSISVIPDHDCDLLFRNDNQKGMARFYTGRWDKENGFWSRSGYTDQTHYQYIKL